jgi:hypothetical protein
MKANDPGASASVDGTLIQDSGFLPNDFSGPHPVRWDDEEESDHCSSNRSTK